MGWFRESRMLATSSTFSEYLIERVAPEIRDLEVAVPIAALSIESQFPVGRVVLRPISEGTLNAWFEPSRRKADTPERLAAFEKYLQRKRKELQGGCAAVVTVRAEFERATQIAVEEASAAAALIRCYGPASFNPRLTFPCVPYGMHSDPGFESYSFEGGELKYSVEQSIRSYDPHWSLSNQEIEYIRSYQLDQLSEIYRNPKTPLHESILRSVMIFSRVAIVDDLSDKLVLLFSALESLFLKSAATEPIQHNLADRLALVVGRDLRERREIAATTKAAYGLRSRSVHHGRSIHDLTLLDRFFLVAWTGISWAIRRGDRYPGRDEMLQAIDDQKFA